MQKVVCFGPGPRFKGGISNYNTSLAKAFDQLGAQTHIVSWSQQYPAIIPREFVDKASQSDFLEGTDIKVHYTLNYNNPLSWRQTVNRIEEINPDILVVQWAIAIQGIPLAYLTEELRKRLPSLRIVYDLHFVIQKEQSKVDERLTKRALQHATQYITHAHKTTVELEELLPNINFTQESNGFGKRIFELYHPVYSLFEPQPDFDVQAFRQQYGLKKHVFLFFGFIRKYKGLHHVIRAFKQLEEQRDDVSLMICGESFWHTLDKSKWTTRLKQALFGGLKKLFLSNKEDEQSYRPLELLETLEVKNAVVFNEFIPNEDVHKYFQASDNVLLFYDYATPSGIESLAYNFSKPMLATKVGHFPETIMDGLNGYLAEPGDIDSMTAAMNKAINAPIDRDNIERLAEDLSWAHYAQTILDN